MIFSITLQASSFITDCLQLSTTWVKSIQHLNLNKSRCSAHALRRLLHHKAERQSLVKPPHCMYSLNNPLVFVQKLLHVGQMEVICSHFHESFGRLGAMHVSTVDVGLDGDVSMLFKLGVGVQAGGRSGACCKGELCLAIINGLKPKNNLTWARNNAVRTTH